MKVAHPIHQRIDILSKILGVTFVAVGFDRFRGGNLQAALMFGLLGGLISLTPFLFSVRKPKDDLF